MADVLGTAERATVPAGSYDGVVEDQGLHPAGTRPCWKTNTTHAASALY
jgi:hypothetical protein